jgi:Rieske Fe-S protein
MSMTEPTRDERTSAEPQGELSRRVVLRGAAGSAVLFPLLAACGGEASNASDTGSGGGATKGASGDVLTGTADVPVGGGEILDAQKVVVTQPSKGEFKAFSAVCTHQQCLVAQITDGKIVCPCHGSQFSVEDGSVVGGPAPSPLPKVAIDVKGDRVVRA